MEPRTGRHCRSAATDSPLKELRAFWHRQPNVACIARSRGKRNTRADAGGIHGTDKSKLLSPKYLKNVNSVPARYASTSPST